MRRSLGMLVGGMALVAAVAPPAGVAVRHDAAGPRRGSAGRPQACYGHHPRGRSEYCTDERAPQHDGRGSILF
ncbi:MAG TPA: hypothetical protein VG034_06400 [Acidimicrobiia bacterium]|nr:hypothetical protein [Acidimicrobiia bacterium]